MADKKIYPEMRVDVITLRGTGNSFINMDGDVLKIILETYFRKKHRGKYYLWRCFREIEIKGIDATYDIVIQHITRFYEEIYRNMILGKVSTKIVDIWMKPIYELDQDQRSEEERLKSTMV